jgi:hypothetical protein
MDYFMVSANTILHLYKELYNDWCKQKWTAVMSVDILASSPFWLQKLADQHILLPTQRYTPCSLPDVITLGLKKDFILLIFAKLVT